MTAQEPIRLVVLGASGFIGGAVLDAAAADGLAVLPVARSVAGRPGWLACDLGAGGLPPKLLAGDDVVINLATDLEAESMMGLLAACRAAGVRRLLHVSTATVVGASRAARVDEATPCRPGTDYERRKWTQECQLRHAAGDLDLAILRPTAVIGAGGLNLLSLAHSLLRRRHLANYARACLFGERAMHLVPVATVAAAILHLARLPAKLAGEVFIVAADDDPDNRFLRVEGVLREALGVEARRWPLLPLPAPVLKTVLRLRGRSDVDADRMYSAEKLRATGFSAPGPAIAAAVGEFGHWYRRREAGSA